MNDVHSTPQSGDGGPRTSYTGDDDGTLYFILMMFDWDDTIASVETIKAKTVPEAKTKAEWRMLSAPHLAGYQLWLRGSLVIKTFPYSVGTPGTPTTAH